jgi:uncharacterized membrane protein
MMKINLQKFWMSLALTTLLVSGFTLSAQAQDPTARLQVIHNAADPGAAAVDIYVNGGLLLDNFAFRAATPFIDVPAGVELSIAVAPPTSTSVDDAIATFPVTLADGETYVVFANGVLNPDNFAANPGELSIGFTLFPVAGAREAAENTDNVEFFVFHGATDAPAVDVLAGDAKLVDGAAYGDATGYLSVPPASYILDITPAGANETIVATFEADLSGLAGGSAVVAASGFLTPSANQDGAAFTLIAVLADGTVIELPAYEAPAPTARLQVIHNAADPGAAAVDIYVNGGLLLDNFAFRAATPFIDVPAGVELSIAVAPPTSTSVDDAIATFPVTLADGETYVVFANGVLNPDNFAANPGELSIGFSLYPVAGAREAAENTDNVEFFVFHGATDAPAVDVLAGDAKLVDGAAYGDATGYLSVPPASYILDITPAGANETIVATFEADLSGLAGGSAVVAASGFLTPSANQDGPAFTLIAVLADGTVIELPAYEAPAPTARLQVIHNAADPGAAAVDIYVNGGLLLDNFAFRAATPFIDVPAGVELSIAVAPPTSTSVDDAIATFPVTLADGETYVVFANGVLNPDNFAANPGELSIGFSLYPVAGAREAAENTDNVEFFVFHGATDAPAVDVLAGDAKLVDGAAYGDATGYLSVPPASYILDITPAGANETIVATFEADLSGLAGGSAVVAASGFLTPSANQDGAAFTLIAVLADGTVIELPAYEAPAPTARLQVIHNAADPGAAAVDIYVNGGLLLDNFAFRAATPFIDVPAGVELSIAVAPPTSTSVDDAIATFPVTLADGETYVVFANGVLNPDNFAANPDELSIGFSLYPVAGAREAAENTDNVEFFVFHGATDAPAVDVLAGDAKLVDGAAYGDATGYLSVPAGVYSLDITPAGANETIVATFTVDLAGAAGASAVAFASGFLNPAANGDGEAFALALALADGTVLVVTPTSNGREISDLPVVFALEQNYPNPFNPTTNINYSLPEASDVTLSVYNIQGQRVATLVNNRIEAGRHTVSFDGSGLASGLYLYRITAGGFSQTAKMMLIK